MSRRNRFSDNRLVELEKQLQDHVARFEDHESAEVERATAITHHLESNTEKLNKLHLNTDELLTAWRDLIGTKKTLTVVGRWLGWLAAMGTSIAIIVSYWGKVVSELKGIIR